MEILLENHCERGARLSVYLEINKIGWFRSIDLQEKAKIEFSFACEWRGTSTRKCLRTKDM